MVFIILCVLSLVGCMTDCFRVRHYGLVKECPLISQSDQPKQLWLGRIYGHVGHAMKLFVVISGLCFYIHQDDQKQTLWSMVVHEEHPWVCRHYHRQKCYSCGKVDISAHKFITLILCLNDTVSWRELVSR